MSKSAIAGALGFGGLLLMGYPGEAGAQQHWFFGNYGYYDGDVYYPQPRPRPRYHYTPVYPRPWFWRGVPRRGEIVEYEVAPGQWVRVYPDGTHEPIARPGRRHAKPDRVRPRVAKRPAAKQAVPVPKEKPPTATESLAASEPLDEPKQLATTSKSLEVAEPSAPSRGEEGSVDRLKTGSLKTVSCEEAQRIVADFGFSDVKARTCTGKTYDLEAMRDGKPYEIKLSAADGELTEVKKR